MRHLKLTLLFALAFWYACVPTADAKHLVGGSLTYDFLGTTPGGDHRYRIQMRIYRDARPPTTNFDDFIEIGVYEDDLDLNRDQTIFIPYDSNEKQVSIPSGGSNCSFSPGFDFRQAIYEDTVVLPPSQFGYHLAHPRCCRNAPANLVPNMGQWYYAFIPPTKRQNTSPDFNSVPAPYICVGDTVQLSYQTFEPDGDSLAYKLVDPYTGGGAPPLGDPKPGPPVSLPLPLSTVDYSQGFSLANPFGSGGVAKINSSTGVATFSAPKKGRYAIAVEIQEYRNGKLISSTRRDIQIIVTDCPPNAPPESKIPPGDSSRRNFDVIEGNKARFSAKFFDKDPQGLEVSGGVFEEVKPPRATFSSSTRADTLTAKFQWETQCYHGRKPPYVFNFRVVDSGCPPKTTISTFKLHVLEYPGAAVSGPDTVCMGNSVKYQAQIGKTGSDSVEWRVTGGRVISGRQTDTVLVKWQSAGFQTIEAITTNINGCNPDTARMQVHVVKPPYGAAGPDTALCGGDTIRLGSQKPDSLNQYDWSGDGLVGDTDTANPVYARMNKTGNLIRQTLLPEINRLACSITDTVKIKLKPKPFVSRIKGDSMPCLDEKITYEAQSPGGIQFNWFSKGGKINAGSDVARVTWQGPDTGWVGLTTTNVYGCASDTFRKGVDVINPMLDTIFGTEVVCPNSTRIRYWVDSVVENDYFWSVQGGRIAQGQTDGQIRVNWGDSGSGYVQLCEKTPQGCLSDTQRLPIQIAYRLETSPVFGDTNVCEQSTHRYNVRYTNGSNYQWWVDNGRDSQSNPGNTIKVNWGKAGTGKLAVLETSYDSVNDKFCRGDTIRQVVDLNPLPNPGPIQGPENICQDDTAWYYVDGFDSSTYAWGFDTSRAEKLVQKNDSIKLKTKQAGTLALSLREVTKDSCLSPLKQTTTLVKSRPIAKKIRGQDTVCKASGLEKAYTYPLDSLSRLQWRAKGGFLKDTTGNKVSVAVRWVDSGVQSIMVKEIAGNGCAGPKVSQEVTVDKLNLSIQRVTTKQYKPDKLQLTWNATHKQYWDQSQSISRKPDSGDFWQTVKANIPPGRKQYNDPEADPNTAAFGYEVTTKNICRDIVVSDFHQAVWLKSAKAGNRSLKLNWTPYQGWASGVKTYEVLRRVTDTAQQAQYTSVKQLSGNRQSFTLESPAAGATQCYRIKAIGNSNKSGNKVSWSNEICREFPAYVFIPNAFSPWDDNGVNDAFKVTTANLKSFSMTIYNRWGERIFQTTDPNEGWNGQYNGEPAPSGVYMVKLRFKGNGGVQTRQKALRLLR